MILIVAVGVPLGLAPNKHLMAIVLACLAFYYYGLITVGYLTEHGFLGRVLGTALLVLLALLLIPVVILAVGAFVMRELDS